MSKKMLISSEFISSKQTNRFRDLANAKGVTYAQFQAALDDGRIAQFLDVLKVDLTPPLGARLHTVHIRSKLDREWNEAISALGSNTPSDYNVWKVSDQYTPPGTGEIEKDLILINFLNEGGFDDALAWAKSKQLENTDPREVFATGEQYPKLYEELKQDPMYVVATKECTFQSNRHACHVWWDNSKRKAFLSRVKGFDRSNYGWFAFRTRHQ